MMCVSYAGVRHLNPIALPENRAFYLDSARRWAWIANNNQRQGDNDRAAAARQAARAYQDLAKEVQHD